MSTNPRGLLVVSAVPDSGYETLTRGFLRFLNHINWTVCNLSPSNTDYTRLGAVSEITPNPQSIREVLETFGAHDYFLVIGDVWMFYRVLEVFKSPMKCTSLAYAALDESSSHTSLSESPGVRALSLFDHVIPYTYYAYYVLSLRVPTPLKLRQPIPHGILPQEDRASRTFPSGNRVYQPDWVQDRPVILWSGRVSRRKDLDAALRIITGFCRTVKPAVLVVHTPPTDVPMANKALEQRPGSAQHTLVNPDTRDNMFAAANMGLSTSRGEGWGLFPAFVLREGIPVVMPRLKVFEEIWGNYPFFYDPNETDLSLSLGISEGPLDQIAKVASMTRVTRNAFKQYSEGLCARYSLENVGQKWMRFFGKAPVCPGCSLEDVASVASDAPLVSCPLCHATYYECQHQSGVSIPLV